MPKEKKVLTGMERLISVKEKQLSAVKAQLNRLTETFKTEEGKLTAKMTDLEAIINALKGKK